MEIIEAIYELPANAPMNEKWYWGVIVDGELRVRTMQGQSLIIELQPTGYRSTGFSTGYLGSGCAETAMAMLSDYFGETITRDSARAGIGKGAHPLLYQQFKKDIITPLPQNTPFVVTATEIAAWLEAHTDLIPLDSDNN